MTPRREASAVFLVLALLSPLGGCGSEQSGEVASPELLNMRADQVMIGLRHWMTRDGIRQAHLVADTAYFYNDSSSIRLRDVEVTFYDQDGGTGSTLTSARGTYDMQTGDMEAEGNVVVVDSARTRRLETPRIRYETMTDRLVSDTSFVWRREGDVVRGTGLITDPGLNTVQIERPSGRSPNPGRP